MEILFDSRHAHAVYSPGRPYRTGWPHDDRSAEDQIVLKVQSMMEPLDVVISFRFRQLIDGEARFVEGAVPYDLDIDDEGNFHLLLKAGTLSRAPLNANWYLKVSREGDVGHPVRLPDPKRPTDQQQRHLAVGEDGRPYYVWPGGRALMIHDLSGL